MSLYFRTLLFLLAIPVAYTITVIIIRAIYLILEAT